MIKVGRIHVLAIMEANWTSCYSYLKGDLNRSNWSTVKKSWLSIQKIYDGNIIKVGSTRVHIFGYHRGGTEMQLWLPEPG